jgi:Ser-tRNA(Ala) deacylase AlaX
MALSIPRTILTYQTQGSLSTLATKLLAITPFTRLAPSDQALFKAGTEDDIALVTAETIFHPQGGGQPSDTGSITSSSGETTFEVSAVRHDAVNEGLVLHLGRYKQSPSKHFQVNDPVTLSIDAAQREYFSRLHTAGHVLGAAVRHLLESSIPNFDELKASHFPDSAACEFQGLIDGSHKLAIQQKVDEYIARDMPVDIDFWDEEDFRREGLERLIPRDEKGKVVRRAEGEKHRVVKIVGAEVYPCGGTHVDSTKACGKVGVRKISRQKGNSRVSYNVSDA